MTEYRSEDLAPLLAPPPGPDMGFRTGTVTAWNPATGENTINVGGTSLTDLPILNNTDVVDLGAGDVVAVMRSGASYFILGRVVLPGAAQLGAAAVKTETASVYANGFNVTAAGVLLGTLSGPVPPGFDRLAMTVLGTCEAWNFSGGSQFFGLSYDSSSATVRGWEQVANGQRGVAIHAATRVSTGWLGQATWSLPVRVYASTGSPAWTVTAGNHAEIEASLIWTRD